MVLWSLSNFTGRNMKTIKLGFSRPSKWKPFSWLIMTAYTIPYDHVYVRMDIGDSREIIYQASGLAVNFMSPAIFAANNVIVNEYTVDISDDSYGKMVQFCIDNAGKPYGIKDIFGLAWVRINYWLGRTVKNPFNDNGATYVCSELGAVILADFAGVTLPEDADDMTPLDVYNLMQSLNQKV